jgi:sec-independent protein translocase protein TatA
MGRRRFRRVALSLEKRVRRIAMGSFSIWHWLVVLVIVLLLFGRGKISEVMGDVAKGVKSFKRGLAEDDGEPARQLDHQRAASVTVEPAKEQTKAT